MLIVILLVLAITWGFWLTYMLRYPSRWAVRVDQHRQILLKCGITLPWVHRLEKGSSMKVLIALLAILTLLCVAILLRHPTALQDFLRDFSYRRDN